MISALSWLSSTTRIGGSFAPLFFTSISPCAGDPRDRDAKIARPVRAAGAELPSDRAAERASDSYVQTQREAECSVAGRLIVRERAIVDCKTRPAVHRGRIDRESPTRTQRTAIRNRRPHRDRRDGRIRDDAVVACSWRAAEPGKR